MLVGVIDSLSSTQKDGEVTTPAKLIEQGDVRAALAEFLGTLLLVFLGPGTVVVTGTLGPGDLGAARLMAIALAFGLAVTAIVAATARLSGGHINPAVTFTALVTGKLSLTRSLLYIAAQLVGAVVGALLIKAVVPGDGGTLGATALAPGVGIGAGLVIEIILTFVLVFVIFSTAVDPKGLASLAPLAIGLTVAVDILMGGPLTGASMNPARSFGPALVSGTWTNHWIFWVGPLGGGVLGGMIYQRAYLR